MFNRTIKFITLWGPLVGIGVWGGFHAVDCAQTLFSPGTGVAFEYPTPGGNLRFRCRNYSFDPLSGSIFATDVEIRQPDGKLIAKVPKLSVMGLYFDGTLAPRTFVTDGAFWVRRESNGKIDLSKYFQQKEEEPTQIAFDVELKNCRLNFIDEAANGVPNDVLKITTARVVGQGLMASGHAKVGLNQYLTGKVDFEKFSDHIYIEGKGLEALPAPLLARLRSGPEAKLLEAIKPLKVEGGKLNGDLVLDLGRQTRWEVKTTGDLLGIAWDKYGATKAKVTARINENGFVGKADAERQGTTAQFDGSGKFGKQFELAAKVTAKQVTPTLLKDFGLTLPKEISVQIVDSDGWLSIAGATVEYTGDVRAKQVKAFKLGTPLLEGNLHFADNRLSGTWKPLKIGNTTINGQFGADFTKNQWQAYAVSSDFRSDDFKPWAPTELSGTAGKIELIAAGKGSKFQIKAVGKANPKVTVGGNKLAYNNAEFAIDFDGKQVKVERFKVDNPEGVLFATGAYDLKRGFDLRIQGTGIDLTSLYKTAKGRADVRGTLTGTATNPQFIGDLNGYDVSYGDLQGQLSAVAGQINVNRRGVDVRNLLAQRGAAQIGGGLRFDFKSQQMNGGFSVKGLDIQELYKGMFDGLLDIENIKVTGTAGKPVVTADINTQSLVARDFKIEDVKGALRYENGEVKITDASANVAGGKLEGIAAVFNPTTKNGQVTGNFNKLKVDELTDRLRASTQDATADEETQKAVLGSDITIQGGLGGNFKLDIAKGEVAKLTSTGRLEDIRLNKAFFGSGDWSLGFGEDKWTFDGFFGSLEDYIRVDAASYNTRNGRLGGELIAYNLPLKELLLAAEPQLAATPDTFEMLKKVSGKIGLVASFSGDSKQPVVEVPDFSVSTLKLGEEDLGTFKLKGLYANRDVQITDGSLIGPKINKIAVPFAGVIQLPDRFSVPDGTVNFSGRLGEQKDLSFKATMFGFPVSKFAPLVPQLEKVDVFVSRADLSASGSLSEPLIAGSVIGSAAVDAGKDASAPSFLRNRLKFNADLTSQRRNDYLDFDLKSKLSFNSLEGFANSKFSINQDLQFAENEPFFASLGLDGKRSLAPFLKDADGLDMGAGATVEGTITATNTYASPNIMGALVVQAPQIKYTKPSDLVGGPISTWIKNFESQLTIVKDPKLGFVVKNTGQGTTNYSENGFLSWNLDVPLKDAELNGRLSLKDFTLGQTFPENTYASLTVNTASPLTITGSLTKPKIKGEMLFSKVKTAVPTLTVVAGDGRPPLVNPEFDLSYRTTDLAEIKAGTADLKVRGSGTLKGPLAEIEAKARFLVDNGTIAMPGGKVKLQPDGTLDLSYSSTALDEKAKLVTNLRGDTSLTALKNSVTPERYDISLEMRGDLLSPAGLALTATSQPGDLTQERILQLLGRTDLLQNVFQQGTGGNLESDLRNALTSIALPNLLGGFTNNIAKNVGFDYVSIDYNPFELASVNFAKSLDRGFFLQGRRQVLPPLPGQPVAYDFRLAYRPRRGPDAIRGLSFSIGTDQFRPYKISIDFTQRVRTQNAPMRTIVFERDPNVLPTTKKEKPPYQLPPLDVPKK